MLGGIILGYNEDTGLRCLSDCPKVCHPLAAALGQTFGLLNLFLAQLLFCMHFLGGGGRCAENTTAEQWSEQGALAQRGEDGLGTVIPHWAQVSVPSPCLFYVGR